MKVHTTQPVIFETGQPLTPEDLNAISLYAKDALADVVSRRFAHGLLVLQYTDDGNTPIDETYSAEDRSFRFTCPVTCIIQRAFLHANLTSDDEVKWTLTKASDGSTPTGVTVPYLSTGAAVASAADDTTDINVDRFVLTAGTEYKITVSIDGAGTFDLERADVVLHTLTDRWTTAGTTDVPALEPELFGDDDSPNGTTVAGVASSLTTEATRLASEVNAPTPCLVALRRSFANGADTDLLTFPIVNFDPTRAQAVLRRLYVYASMSGTGGSTVTATVKNRAGATVATASANVAGVTQASGDSGAIAIDLDSAGGDSSDGTKDFSVVLECGAGATCTLGYALAWIGR